MASALMQVVLDKAKNMDSKQIGLNTALSLTALSFSYFGYKKYRQLPPTPVPKFTLHYDVQTSYGGRLFAEALKNQGVKVVFTLVGGHISPILVGCENLDIKVVDVRHEVNAAFAADAASRLSGIPGVAIVTAGPGVTNTVTALKNAQSAQSPLILVGGAASDLLKGRGALQDIDQMAVVKPYVKWSKHIGTVKEIPAAIEYAFWIAQSGTPGPVFLEVPLDVLYSEKDTRALYETKKTSASLVDKAINWYLGYHLNKIFSGVSKVTFNQPLPPSVPSASDRQVNQVLNILKSAKSPLLIVGSQVMLQVETACSGAISDAIHKINIPATLSGMARGVLGANSNIQIKQKLTRRKAMRESDVIILAGVPMDFRLDYGRSISGKSKIIMINRDQHDLYLNSAVRPASVAILADPTSVLLKLADSVNSISSNWADWHRSLLAAEDENESNIEVTRQKDVENNKNRKYISPIYLCQQIEKYAGENAVFVADGGDFVGTAAYILKPRSPLSWLDPGPFGTLGVGSAFAMAAQVCNPSKEIWIIFGDGAVGFSIAEFDTMVRHKIPVIAVIGNDAAWTQILREQEKYLGSDVACSLSYTDYQECAIGLGARGIIVTEESQVPAALERAKKIANEERLPVLVNALISKSNFREGSISV